MKENVRKSLKTSDEKRINNEAKQIYNQSLVETHSHLINNQNATIRYKGITHEI